MTEPQKKRLIVSALFTDRPYNIYPAPVAEGWNCVFFSNSDKVGELAEKRGWTFCKVNLPEALGDYTTSSLQSKWVKFLQFMKPNDLIEADFSNIDEVIYFDHKFWVKPDHIRTMLAETDGAAILIRETPVEKSNILQEVEAARGIPRYEASMPATEAYIADKVAEGTSMEFRICNTGLIHYRRPQVGLKLANEVYDSCMKLNQPECQIFWAIHAQNFGEDIRVIPFGTPPVENVQWQDPVEALGASDRKSGIMIAGFHRSGTSALTELLHCSGVSAGDDLMDGNEFNKNGHFESWAIVRLHDRIMNDSGCDWATPLSQRVQISMNDLEQMRDYARERESKGQYWIVKDPRSGRFLEEWKQAVPSLKFLIVYRDPAASIYSLQRRSMQLLMRSGGMNELNNRFIENPDLGPILWRDHNKKLMDFAQQHPNDCLVVGQASIMNGFDVIDAINKMFGFDIPDVGDQVDSLDKRLLTQDPPPLYVQSEELRNDILRVWDKLCDLDISDPADELRENAERNVILDTGSNAMAQLLRVQVDEAIRIVRSKESHNLLRNVSYNTSYHELTEIKRHSEIIARRIMRPPFSWYFRRKQKYRKASSTILGKKY